MTKLNYWNETWSLDEAQCPCDLHFVEYLQEKEAKDAAIFHFGTGNHHIVGLRLRRTAPTAPCSASPPRRRNTTTTSSC